MDLFEIDKDKCNNDGICAIECPAQIIKMTEDGPALLEGAEERCIQCGHCVAVCPVEAIVLKNFLTPEQCMPIKKELGLDIEQTEYFLRSRRSIRRYKDKPVPRDLFEKALATASCAPTGSNKQSVRWLVVDNKKDVEQIAEHTVNWMRSVMENFPEIGQMLNMEVIISQCEQGIDRICRDAPQLVFAYASDEFGMAAADCHTALAYLELVLPSHGLGSCWAGYITAAMGQWSDLAGMINIPGGYTCHGVLMVGIPKFRYRRIPKRNPPDIRYHA